MPDLIAALLAHDLRAVDNCLAAGADPNEPDRDGWRPLHHAIGQLCVGGPLDCVQHLLEHGADPNGWDINRNEPPLLSAMHSMEVAAARLLLERGADANAQRSTGERSLQLAAEAGRVDMARLLLEHGATATMDAWSGLRGLTPLGIAARQFDLPMIQALLDAGADPWALDEYDEFARDKLPARDLHDPDVWDEVAERLSRRDSGGISD